MYCKKVTLKSGKEKWECIEDGPADPVTGKRKQIKRRGKTKKEAKAKVKREIEKQKGGLIDSNMASKVTFDMAANHWLKVYELTGVKSSTLRVRQKEIKILNKHIEKMPIKNITHTHYQHLINKIAPNYARTTVQGVNTCAGMIFRQAVKDKVIKADPSRDVVIPRKRKTVEEIETDNIEKKYLEKEELEQFLQATKEHGKDLDIEWFYLLAFTGMRVGEMLALKWSDLDFATNEIRITKTIYNPNNNMRNYELTPPKTEGSIRTVNVEKEIMNLLESHKRRQSKIKMKYRHEIEEYHDENFVFAHVNGYPFIHKNVSMRMQRLLGFTIIEKHVTPHILRHTHISMMAEANIDLPTIMEKVGHEDIQTTMKIYTHVTKRMKKDASHKMQSLYENALSYLI